MNLKPLKRLFEIDTFSLSVFRIFLGVFGLCDLLIRGSFLTEHYTDFGVLPRKFLFDGLLNQFQFSIHMMSGNKYIELVLFTLHALFLISLIVGYRTRWATLAVWFFTVSMQNRSALMNQGGDAFYRVTLFWSMFVPLNHYLSLDSLLWPRKDIPRTFFSFGGAGLLLQVAIMYVFTALLKTGDQWQSGTAIFFALNVEQLARPLAVWIRQFPGFLKILTPAVLFLEQFGAILLFCPIFFLQTRLLGILLFFGLQLGFNLCLALGPFPYISTIALIPFLPTEFWDYCKKFKFANTLKAKWNRVKARVKVWPEMPSLLKNLPPEVYRSAKIVRETLAACFLFYILLWNLRGVPQVNAVLPERGTGALAFVFGVDQYWNMFSPNPQTYDGWFVLPGKLIDGTAVDVFRKKMEPASFDKPRYVADMYPTERDRKYLMILSGGGHPTYMALWTQYLCRSWNEDRTDEKRLREFDVYFMIESTTATGKAPVEKRLMQNQKCL